MKFVQTPSRALWFALWLTSIPLWICGMALQSIRWVVIVGRLACSPAKYFGMRAQGFVRGKFGFWVKRGRASRRWPR